MAYWQDWARGVARIISPSFYKQTWSGLEGKTFSDAFQSAKVVADRQVTKLWVVHVGTPGRDSIRRPYGINSFMATLALPGFGVWLGSKLFFRDPRQRKAAQITAAAYGQGGQNVAACPK